VVEVIKFISDATGLALKTTTFGCIAVEVEGAVEEVTVYMGFFGS
jgi:hypothetical protein